MYAQNWALEVKLTLGAFAKYVGKMRWVGGTGNVNGTQISPQNSKGIPSQMSTRGSKVVKRGQNPVNVVCERPITFLLTVYGW